MPVTLSSPLNVFGGNTDMTDLVQLTTGATGAIGLTATSRPIQLIQTSGNTTVTLPVAGAWTGQFITIKRVEVAGATPSNHTVTINNAAASTLAVLPVDKLGEASFYSNGTAIYAWAADNA